MARNVAAVNGPAWVGYAVPVAAGAQRSCRGVFDLEHGGGYASNENDDDAACWLGQSNDPRALALIEEVLLK